MIFFNICLNKLAGGKKADQKESDHSNAPPSFWLGRQFSLTNDERSHGWGKSCWSEFTSASMSCRAAHLWLVEEASFSSSVAWSSCWWRDVGSSTGVVSCNMKVVAVTESVGRTGKSQMAKYKCRSSTHLGLIRQWRFLWRPLHSESITEKKENDQSLTFTVDNKSKMDLWHKLMWPYGLHNCAAVWMNSNILGSVK